MARTKDATEAAGGTKPDESKAVTVVSSTLPAELQDQMESHAGKGVSTLARDNIIPLIYVMQAQSPQVNQRNAAYVKDMTAGCFWLRNSSVPVVDGEAGLAFQPCHFQRYVIEWVPRDMGGGFVARHDFLTPDEDISVLAKRVGAVEEKSDDRRLPSTWRLGDNELREVRAHAGYVYGGLLGLQDHPSLVLPFVIPFGGTGHSVSRGWMTQMNQHASAKDPSVVLPSFSRLYRLTTRLRQNAKGEWYQIEVSDDLGWVPDKVAFQRGLNLYEAMERGEKQAEAPVDTGSEDIAGGAAADRAGV